MSACAGARTTAADAGARLDCSGEGEPAVVLIPGASRGAADWDTVRAAVGPRVRTCAWEPPHTVPRDAEGDARLLLDALGGKAHRWILVGHSYGGLVLRVAAARQPSGLAGALFVDAAQEDGFDPAQVYPVTEKQPIDWIASFQEAVSVGVPKGVPVLALVAAQQDLPDWEPWLASQRKLVAKGAPGDVVLVERSGHHIPRDRPDAVAEAIHRLLPP